jgi:hypothetical protein
MSGRRSRAGQNHRVHTFRHAGLPVSVLRSVVRSIRVYRRNYSSHVLALSATVVLGVGGCSPHPRATAAQPGSATRPMQPISASPGAAPYRLTATVQDLMDGIVDPSADALWDSVAYIATTRGVEDRRPRTEEEWKAVRYSAITLIEAANLLSMPGRKVAVLHGAPGTDTPPGPGELTHAQIQQRMDSAHAGFEQFARNLQDAGLQALAAIDAKDADRLLDAGGIIDSACEACHVTFWYPDQSRLR